MKTMTKKERADYLQKWEKKRANKWWYIIKYGVLFYAMPAFAALAVYATYISRYDHLTEQDFFTGLFLWNIMGVFFGYCSFNINEKRYSDVLEVEQEMR